MAKVAPLLSRSSICAKCSLACSSAVPLTGGEVVDDEALLPFAIGFQFIEKYIFWSPFQVTFCTCFQAVVRVYKNDITVLGGRQGILHPSVAICCSLPAGFWTIGGCAIESEGFFVKDCTGGHDAAFSYA